MSKEIKHAVIKNEEVEAMIALENYEDLDSLDKLVLPYALDQLDIPATRVDLGRKETRDVIGRVLADRFKSDSIGAADVVELDRLSRQAMLKVKGPEQFDVTCGTDKMELTYKELKDLKALMESIDLKTVREYNNK